MHYLYSNVCHMTFIDSSTALPTASQATCTRELPGIGRGLLQDFVVGGWSLGAMGSVVASADYKPDQDVSQEWRLYAAAALLQALPAEEHCWCRAADSGGRRWLCLCSYLPVSSGSVWLRSSVSASAVSSPIIRRK